MAKKNEKVNKGIKADRRAKVILGMIITVILLIIAAFFINLSGLIPRIFTGIKITENVNGQQAVIENISVAEATYQYASIYNTYAQYNMFTADTIDDVMDPTTGKTYRQWLLDQAAEKLKTIIIINRDAEQNDYLSHSGAAAYAEANIESARAMAGLYGYPSLDTYLQAMYGSGMNTALYRDCLIRETLAQEYQQYMTQFGFQVTDEQIQAAYDQNESLYQMADYCIYYFGGEHLDDGSVDTEDAMAAAQAVVDAATDADSFTEAVIDNISEEDAIAAGLISPTPSEDAEEEDADVAPAEEATEDSEPVNPLLHENETAQTLAYGAEGLSDFLFDSGEIGSATVLTSDYGAYAVYLIDRHLDEEPVVAYRSFQLTNDTRLENGATQEEVDAAYQALIAEANAMVANPMTALQFADLVKEHSSSSSGIIYGGYNQGITADNFVPGEGSNRAEQMEAEGAWLFDPARQPGDTYISVAADQRTLTVFYFERNDPSWVNSARTEIINTNVSEWAQGLNANAPSYLISYDLMKKLGR
ncbi:MAG: hypothetical protein J5685_05260 [Clostridiales bacterium]|nr:hypothetical protein [Clostridiales bacterium]